MDGLNFSNGGIFYSLLQLYPVGLMHYYLMPSKTFSAMQTNCSVYHKDLTIDTTLLVDLYMNVQTTPLVNSIGGQ